MLDIDKLWIEVESRILQKNTMITTKPRYSKQSFLRGSQTPICAKKVSWYSLIPWFLPQKKLLPNTPKTKPN